MINIWQFANEPVRTWSGQPPTRHNLAFFLSRCTTFALTCFNNPQTAGCHIVQLDPCIICRLAASPGLLDLWQCFSTIERLPIKFRTNNGHRYREISSEVKPLWLTIRKTFVFFRPLFWVMPRRRSSIEPIGRNRRQAGVEKLWNIYGFLWSLSSSLSVHRNSHCALF